jgi:5-methyltetrahydrofolate--homocysteine methyltransferase
MIIIGEKINATRKQIASALEQRDESLIAQVVREQDEAGADYIDCNGGDPREGAEVRNMEWLMKIIAAHTDKPVAVDSANPEAVDLGLGMAEKMPILNSVSLESDRLEPLLPMVEKYDCMVVALLMSDAGTPCAVDDRLANAEKLVEKITACGKSVDRIIVDPCFLPISADPSSGMLVLEAIRQIRAKWPEIHIGGGLSNISYGLPKRKVVNMAALAQCILSGMDSAIVDPCIEGIVPAILAAEAIVGRDEFCMNYVTRMR